MTQEPFTRYGIRKYFKEHNGEIVERFRVVVVQPYTTKEILIRDEIESYNDAYQKIRSRLKTKGELK